MEILKDENLTVNVTSTETPAHRTHFSAMPGEEIQIPAGIVAVSIKRCPSAKWSAAAEAGWL
jgi:hypothetical protein